MGYIWIYWGYNPHWSDHLWSSLILTSNRTSKQIFCCTIWKIHAIPVRCTSSITKCLRLYDWSNWMTCDQTPKFWSLFFCQIINHQSHHFWSGILQSITKISVFSSHRIHGSHGIFTYIFSIQIHHSWIGKYTILMDLLDLWSLIQGNCFNDIYSRDAGCRELAKVRFCHRVEAPLTKIE